MTRHERAAGKYAEVLVLDHYLDVLKVKRGALPVATKLAQARAAGAFTRRPRAQGRRPVRYSRTLGSVRGVACKGGPYRDPGLGCHVRADGDGLPGAAGRRVLGRGR